MNESKLEKVFLEFDEELKKQEECKKKGHPGEIVRDVFTYGFKTRADCYCIECGNSYARPAYPSEV